MKRWELIVNARKPGAIGVFTPTRFYLHAPDAATEQQVKDLWFDQYATYWESAGIAGVREVPDVEVSPPT